MYLSSFCQRRASAGSDDPVLRDDGARSAPAAQLQPSQPPPHWDREQRSRVDIGPRRLLRNHPDHRNVGRGVTEQQEYSLVTTFDGVELRHYPTCTLAEITVDGPADKAGNVAFRPLVSYISGSNVTKAKLAMTAPVIQEPIASQEPTTLQQPSGEVLAMTAPVLQEDAGGQRWTVSFVLPGARARADYPQPTDPRVVLREVEGHYAAAIRWSGRWMTSNVDKNTERLLATIGRAGWRVTGAPRWARYNPPWTPAFARRNEIIVAVDPGPDAECGEQESR